ncbi:MAG: Glycosyl transferase family 2 [Parcubacteria group bacterium GW2011_GWD2_38_11]|uniref:Glycosyl transferase family 2 n=1 Tax=Candidatus Magasanikbacteria bacterium GW2011_GWE2_42_7 TaxID=1619052 RepID=A0A0G1DHP2_9BACT|nr:MAG: Glycosyl transferase family 2 [Parcubacteria group bacterium GW2011_GWD2_38_11]KKS70331.1 MAG: Glycosyl transferase family 2 [Candidatus Magasanikbacteria bacterium GW2011_GWE2_42_7]
MSQKKLISIICPVYNEEENISLFHAEVQRVISSLSEYDFEIIFVNDGSEDVSDREIKKLKDLYPNIGYIEFSRNFGKEMATTAGIHNCQGDACIMIDADLQHPVELIPEFIQKWEEGAEVVVGVRKINSGEGLIKKIGSIVFYKIINRIAEIKVLPNATDYRLLDRIVIDEFNRFTEANRMTRALIDWLGFRRAYVEFKANERIHGVASYNFWKLFRLAVNSFISLSLLPLKIAGYLGTLITLVSGSAGFYILLGKYFFRTPFASTFSDAENLAILLVFLVGIILMSVGLMALYIANIHGEVINRPIYVVRKNK